MFFFNEEGRALGMRRKRFPVLIVGAGPGSFIGLCAWIPNALATGCYYLAFAAPSRDAEKCKQFENDFDMPPGTVSNDYAAILRRAVAEHGPDLVVFITTETGYHREHILAAIAAGAKSILVDKPAVSNFAEWKEVQTAAAANEVFIGVSFQHTLNAPTYQIRKIVAGAVAHGDPSAVTIDAGFEQDWLKNPPDIRQTWRLDNKWCGLLDIGSHAADGASVIAGAPIKRILRSVHSMARESKRDKPALDNGTCEVEFANGIRGVVRYHQALNGHADDIYLIANTVERSYQFALEWGGGELLFSRKGGSLRNRADWTSHVRSHDPIFSEPVNNAFGKNPPGHFQGWDNMWQVFFLSAAREILARRNDERALYVIPQAQNPVPTFEGAGRHATLFVDAAIQSFETEKPVELESIAT